MSKNRLIIVCIALNSLFASSCAFFNTFYHARKAYNNGIDMIGRSREQIQPQLTSADIPADRFSYEPKIVPSEAKTFFDVAIEKANKVVVLYPQSRWAEDATLLLGKAHYLRDYTNDPFDAKNRLEVFFVRYPESKNLPEAKLWYGKVLLRLGQIDEAEIQFHDAEEYAEKIKLKSEALILLGDIAVTDQDYSAASGFYGRAAEMADNKAIKKSALYKAFYAYYQIRNYKLAIGYINVLAGMDLDFGEKFDVQFMKARTMKWAGQYNEAIALLNGFIGNLRYKNYFVKAEFEIADALRLAGRNREAIQQFNYVIETYNNPAFTADSYYLLGLIHDRPILSAKETFDPDPDLAKKYYYLVKTKYTATNYFSTATERFEYLTKMDFFRGSIRTDELLIQVIENKIADSNFLINIENYFPEKETAVADVNTENTAAASANKANPDLKKEVFSVIIPSTELDEKTRQIQAEVLEIALVNDRDSLLFRKKRALDILAADYISMADYFYFNLSDFDSASYYYQYVADRFRESPMLEFALYGLARVQQKKVNPDYKSFYENAYRIFPQGQLADIGRRALSLKEDVSDSARFYMELAEMHFLRENNYTEALKCYQRVALKDSSYSKLQALYAMGLLYEKKMNDPVEAFRSYTTLVFADPNSSFAKKVKPKVDAYAREKKISEDSLVYWVNGNYVRIEMKKIIPDTTHVSKAVPGKMESELKADSVRSRLPQEIIILDDDDRMPADSARAMKSRKERANKSPIKSNAKKEKEPHDILKDE